MQTAHVTYAPQYGPPLRKWPRYRGLSASPAYRATSWQRYVGSICRPPCPKTCQAPNGCRLRLNRITHGPVYCGCHGCGCGTGSPRTMGDPISDLFDIFSGGPQKRERTAKANRDAAQAARDAAIAQAQSAVEIAQINLAYQHQQFAQLKELLLKGGIVAAAGVAVYAVLR